MKRWLKEGYPGIRKQARSEDAEIHLGDEMGMRSDHQAGPRYRRKDTTPVVPGTGQRFGCNMISTVINRGRLAFMVFTKRSTTVVALESLR